MAMTELADEELTGVVPKLVEDETTAEWKDIGYYRDANGVRHFGVPETTEFKLPGYKWGNEHYDGIRNRTSNPRLFYGSV